MLRKCPALVLTAFAALINGMCGARAESLISRETRLSDRVLILYHAPWEETMTVIDAGPSLIVVDTWGSLAAAREARARIATVFQKPVGTVINTHHHWDHTFGNAAFPEAVIFGHRFCPEDMKSDYADAANRETYFKTSALEASSESRRNYIGEAGRESAEEGFRLVFPGRLVDERETLRVGDLTILFCHTPGIHTRSNLTIDIPELGIVFGRREFSDPASLTLEPGADPVLIARVLEEIISSGKPVHWLIPGHGSPVENPDLKRAAGRLREIDRK